MRFSDLKKVFSFIYAAYAQLTCGKRIYQLTVAITAGTTTTTAPSGSLAVTSHATGQNQLFVSNGTVWLDAGAGAKRVYSAILAQAGTAAPTATILEKTLTGTVVLARSGVGVYTLTLTGAFTTAKTFIDPNVDSGATAVSARGAHTSANVATISTFDVAGAAADLVGNLNLKITVYP